MSDIDHTFVIPAYKDSPYLEECVFSLLAQSYQSSILIATSTPSFYIKSIAEKHGVPYYVSSSPSSIASDWNFALAKAATRYVTIAHQDDIYDEHYSSEILSLIKRNTEKKPLIAFCRYNDIVNGKLKTGTLNSYVKSLMLLPFWFKNSISTKIIKKSILSLGDPICCPSVTIDLKNTNNLRFSESYSCALDWVAWLQLASTNGAFLFTKKKLVSHRIHIDSETTNQIKNGRRTQEEMTILSGIWGKPIARLLSKLYTKGYADNKV